MSGFVANVRSLPPRRIVGTSHMGYPEERNFAGLPLQRYAVRKQMDLFKLPTWFCYRMLNRSFPFLLNSYCDFGLNRCDLVHQFNGLCFGGKPWVVTFETALPRWGWSAVPDWLVAQGVRLLASTGCGRIIALSECAAKIQRGFLRDKFPTYATAVEAKLEVLHPPQKTLVSAWGQKPDGAGELSFLMVGRDFFPKGGMEVLRVFNRLLKERINIRLVIVGRIESGQFVSQTTATDLAEAQAILKQHSSRITHHPSLPYAEVLKLMQRTHVGLLPTWAETYGYSVLEAQAAGCPVITTDIRALPEINNEQVGWLIPVPKDSSGNGLLATREQRADFSAGVEAGLERAIRDILRNRDSVREKGTRSLERIRTHHDPHKAAARLEEIYDSILTVGI